MRRCALLVTMAVSICGLVTTEVSNAYGADKKLIELSLNLGIPESHLRYQNVLKPWIETIEKKSNGAVKITPYFMSSLSPVGEAFDSAVAGLADISEGIQHLTPGKFPLTEVMLLPNIESSAEVGVKTPALTMWKLYEAVPEIQKEYRAAKVLSVYACAMEILMTRGKKVTTLDDLKGMKIHINGRTKVSTGKALGMTPISMSYGEVYLALEKGVLDGGIWPDELLKSRRFAEQLKYVIPVDLSHTCFFLVMNPATWKSLPPEIQKIFEEESGKKLAELEGQAEFKMREEADQWATKTHGVQFVELSADEKSKWERVSQTAIDQWIKDVEKTGLPGRKVYEMRRKFEKEMEAKLKTQ